MIHTIYKITNKQNGKIYIGAHSTNNPDDNYYGSGKLILRALEKYGIKGFTKKILHTFETKEEMYVRESEIVTQEFVNRYDTYNVNIGGSAPPITIHTEESRARVSQQFKGKPISEEHKAKISATKKDGYHPYRGKELTKEHKEKNRQAQIGRKHTIETKAKMRKNMLGENNPNYDRIFSTEHRKKLGDSHRGNKHSDKTKSKISAKAKGNQYAKGHKQTEEHKRKLAEARAKKREKQGLPPVSLKEHYLSSNKPRNYEIVITKNQQYNDRFGIYIKKLNIFVDENGLELAYIKKWQRDGNEPPERIKQKKVEIEKGTFTIVDRNELIMLGVDYEDRKPETYKGVIVYSDKILGRFDSGDYDADMENAKTLAFSINDNVYDSSSVDDFISEANLSGANLTRVDLRNYGTAK